MAVATARTKGIVGREGDEKSQSDDAAARSRLGALPAPRADGVAWPGTSVTRYVRTRHIGTGLRALSAGTSAMEFSRGDSGDQGGSALEHEALRAREMGHSPSPCQISSKSRSDEGEDLCYAMSGRISALRSAWPALTALSYSRTRMAWPPALPSRVARCRPLPRHRQQQLGGAISGFNRSRAARCRPLKAR